MQIDKSMMAGSTALLVLALLRDGEMYGYQMTAELARRSDDTFRLKEGTLYPLLHSLEDGGYVRARMGAAPGGRERKYYRLTRKGRELLSEKTAQWQLFAEKVNAIVLDGAAPSES